MADDIIFGSGDDLEQASTDYDADLKSLLQWCQEKGMKLNREKAEIKLHGSPDNQ